MSEADQAQRNREPELGQSLRGARFELANILFFRLYQCANMLHKTGTKAVESEGLTTQRWAVLGALSRPETVDGMAVGDLARYLKVSRQSLAGVVGRLEADGLVGSEPDPADGRSRRFRLTERGHDGWHHRTLPLIDSYYEKASAGLSIEDMSHALHYVSRLLENMTDIDDNDEHQRPTATEEIT
jgi:DNA-binding MarR family transcriptional regulator